MISRVKKFFYGLIIGLLSVFLTFSIMLYISAVQRISLEQTEHSVEEMTVQICSSFELVVGQIRDQANKLAIHGNQLVEQINKRNQSVLENMRLYDLIRDIAMGNQYIDSTYLYIKEENIILDSERGYSFNWEEFPDREVLNAVSARNFTVIPPRVVKGLRGNKLFYTIVIPLSDLYGGITQDILYVNINIAQLYHDILNRNGNDRDFNLYIYNENGEILLSDNFSDINSNIEEIEQQPTGSVHFPVFIKKEGIVEAVTWSKELRWNFKIQLPYLFKVPAMTKEYFLVVAFIFSLIIVIVIFYIFLGFVTKPIYKILTDYNEKKLSEILLNQSALEEKELNSLLKMFPYNKYLIFLIELAGNKETVTLDIVKEAIRQVQEEVKYKLISYPVQTNSGSIAIICNFNNNSDWEKEYNSWLKLLYRNLNHYYIDVVYIAVSSPNSFDRLSVAYRECEEIQACKISLSDHIFNYGNFRKFPANVIYSSELEKQLVNNLLIGNVDGCMFYVNKFLAYLFENDGMIQDVVIKNHLYQLQNEILNRTSTLPISIKLSKGFILNEIYDKNQIQEMFREWVYTLCQEIGKKDVNNKILLHEAILEYVNTHLTEEDFDLNALSFQFNMNRNYLAKLIEEKTSFSFNEYVNLKKIEISKEFLNTSELTIDEIAHRSGFNYTHYFIKVFKKIEGITPGQYRKIKE